MSKCCKIPDKLIAEAMSQWDCLTEQLYDTFGVDCTVFYLGNSNSATSNPTYNIPQLNSINSRRRSGGQEHNFQDQVISNSEVSEQIKIRIYWNPKEWMPIYGYTKTPENNVMFLAKIEDAEKLSQATKVEFTDKTGKTFTFTRQDEPVPYGFQKDRYCASIWEQSS